MARCAAAMQLRPMASRWLRPGTVGMDTQRLILLFIFGFSVLMLWEAWEREHRPKPAAQAEQPALQSAPNAPARPAAAAPQAIGAAPAKEAAGETIRITTDVVTAD